MISGDPLGNLHIKIDYVSMDRLEIASSHPTAIREKVDALLAKVDAGADATIVTGLDWVVRELNARMMMHDLPAPERHKLMHKYDVGHTISSSRVKISGEAQFDHNCIIVDDIDKWIIRLNRMVMDAYRSVTDAH